MTLSPSLGSREGQPDLSLKHIRLESHEGRPGTQGPVVCRHAGHELIAESPRPRSARPEKPPMPDRPTAARASADLRDTSSTRLPICPASATMPGPAAAIRNRNIATSVLDSTDNAAHSREAHSTVTVIGRGNHHRYFQQLQVMTPPRFAACPKGGNAGSRTGLPVFRPRVFANQNVEEQPLIATSRDRPSVALSRLATNEPAPGRN